MVGCSGCGDRANSTYKDTVIGLQPHYQSSVSINARFGSVHFLQRLNKYNRKLLEHLDFVKVGTEAIKSIL